MDLHILLDSVTNVWKCPKKGFKKYCFDIFYQGGWSNRSASIQFKKIKFGMVGQMAQIKCLGEIGFFLSELKKWGFGVTKGQI